ncbi:MAG: hypothetical protein ACPLPR_08520 [Bacillota bacterium]
MFGLIMHRAEQLVFDDPPHALQEERDQAAQVIAHLYRFFDRCYRDVEFVAYWQVGLLEDGGNDVHFTWATRSIHYAASRAFPKEHTFQGGKGPAYAVRLVLMSSPAGETQDRGTGCLVPRPGLVAYEATLRRLTIPLQRVLR